MHPGWEIMVHGPDIVLPELQQSFDAAQGWSSKSDLMRYSALWVHGGWYFDVDFWPIRPLDGLIDSVVIRHNRVVISKQQGHKSGDRLPYSATPLACIANSPALARIIKAASDPGLSNSRVGYGPSLIKKMVDQHPHDYDILDAHWCFPWSISQMPMAIPAMASGHIDRLPYSIRPICCHMWADAVDIPQCLSIPYDDSLIAVVESQHKGLDPIADGLSAAGFRVSRAFSATEYDGLRPDYVFVWGDRKNRTLEWQQFAQRNGSVLVYVEHGWFDRSGSVQIDTHGIQHRASWAQGPYDGGSHPFSLQPVVARDQGYALVLGQVPGDAQLADSELAGPAPLLRYLSRAAPRDIPIRYRPHPAGPPLNMARFPRVELSPNITPRADYHTHKNGGSGLSADLDGARFAVAINSTALMEASMAGVPCLAFGPACGLNNGAYHPATIGSLPRDIGDMMGGWVPADGAVDNLVGELFSRQHSPDDLRNPEYMIGVLDAITGHSALS